MDASGRGLIREMQLLARAGPAVRLLQMLTFGGQPWNTGYVWVEDGQVVFLPTEVLCPGLKRLLDVRKTIGLRNSAHSLVKLMKGNRTLCKRLPSEYFHRNVRVTFMRDRAGASNKIRYPGELELFGKGRLLLLDSEVGSTASFSPR